MKHLNDDQLYELAMKVAREQDLSPEDAAFLQHVADCDACYQLMCCMMAIDDISNNVGEYVTEAAVQIPVQQRFSAVIRLVVNAVNTAMDQLEFGGWTFRNAPMAMAGARSLRKHPSRIVKKMADPDNSQNFVAYDAGKQLLMIQIDSADCPEPPRTTILLPDGRHIEVRFEKREHLFWAEVSGLAEGEYAISMEKQPGIQ